VRALRQLIASLWAALWVRWRLFAAGARGVFGDRRPAAAGSGYYLAAAEIPVEGVDYELVDLSPELAARLDAARGELVEHARGVTARRARRRRVRRRRTASLAMAALLSLTVLGAGATALVTGSTGIPAVDRLLGIYEKNSGRAGSAGQPDPSVDSTSIEFRAGGIPMVSAWYLARNGDVCSVLTDADRGSSGDLACVTPAEMVESLDRSGGALYSVTEGASGVILRGYTRSDVQRLEGSGPAGQIDLYLGDIWSSGAQGVDSMRPFVGVERGARGRQKTRRDYRLWAVTKDGSRLQILP